MASRWGRETGRRGMVRPTRSYCMQGLAPPRPPSAQMQLTKRVVPACISFYHQYGSGCFPSSTFPEIAQSPGTLRRRARRLGHRLPHSGAPGPTEEGNTAMAATAADAANELLVDRLIAEGALWSPALIAAFRATPRHRFLDRVFQYQRKHNRWREVLTREPGEEELRLVYS